MPYYGYGEDQTQLEKFGQDHLSYHLDVREITYFRGLTKWHHSSKEKVDICSERCLIDWIEENMDVGRNFGWTKTEKTTPGPDKKHSASLMKSLKERFMSWVQGE